MGELLGCVTDFGYTDASTAQASAIINQATVDAAIQTAVALYQRNASASISSIQTALANQQVKLAEEVHAHAKEFWPAEVSLVNDVFAVPKLTAGYTLLSNSFDLIAQNALASGRQTWIDTMRSWCMGPTPCDVARWQRLSRTARVDIDSYACRQDENRVQILNDLRYARELEILGMGRGMVKDLVTYEELSEYSQLSAANVLEGGINAAAATYGFYAAQRVQESGWGSMIQSQWSRPQTPSASANVIDVPNARMPPPFAPQLAGAPNQ